MKLKLLRLFFYLSLIFISACQTNAVNVENNETTQSGKSGESKQAQQYYVSGEYTKAYAIARQLAEKQDPSGQYLLGYLYFNGQGVPVDKTTGIKWIRIAADAGYRPAIEALVMINYGLTPDHKCEYVDNPSQAAVTHAQTGRGTADSHETVSRTPAKLIKVSEEKTTVLDSGEILITGLTDKKITPLTANDDQVITKIYTVQIISSHSNNDIIEYTNRILRSFPQYRGMLVFYRTSKNLQQPLYAAGLGQFDSIGQASLAREEMLPLLKDQTIWVRSLLSSQVIKNQL